MDKVLYFDVVLKERLWGGKTLASKYGKQTDARIGEAWILSGHREGQSIVRKGIYEGRRLDDLYLNEKQLFGESFKEKFPLLIKVLDAQKWLSVQVHPNDLYAKKHHNDFGKNECWYVLDAKKDASIIYGQKAPTKEAMKAAIDNGSWDEVLNYIPVKKGDFFDVPVGTVHAIGKGIEILEIQQSSDVTYRLYDFDRIDKDGKKRDLHIEESLEVIDYDVRGPKHEIKNFKDVTRYVSNQYFTVDKLKFTKETTVLNGTKLYTILFAEGAPATIEIDDKKYVIDQDESVLIPADVNNFKVLKGHSLFIVKERALNLDKMYQM